MYNCANDILAYHDDEVTLPQAERTNMRGRRDANRERLKKGLKDKNKPAPREFSSQGSYAMKTMTQHPAKDYDIDDGVYFEKAVLIGERGAEMTALQARQMVRDALDDGSFKTPPEVRKNCVRVYYLAGYCVDDGCDAAHDERSAVRHRFRHSRQRGSPAIHLDLSGLLSGNAALCSASGRTTLLKSSMGTRRRVLPRVQDG